MRRFLNRARGMNKLNPSPAGTYEIGPLEHVTLSCRARRLIHSGNVVATKNTTPDIDTCHFTDEAAGSL